jgi:hypothetical protein
LFHKNPPRVFNFQFAPFQFEKASVSAAETARFGLALKADFAC